MSRKLVCLLVTLPLLALLVGCTQVDPGFAVVQTSAGVEILVDDSSTAIVTVDFPHHELHEGDFYYIKNFANDGPQSFLATTPGVGVVAHLQWDVVAEGEYDVLVYEDMTVSNSGVALIAQNANRNSLTGAVIPWFSGPTLDIVTCIPPDELGDGGACGELIWAGKVGVGKKTSASRMTGYELMMEQGVSYWFQLEKIGVGALYIDWDFNWYERPD